MKSKSKMNIKNKRSYYHNMEKKKKKKKTLKTSSKPKIYPKKKKNPKIYVLVEFHSWCNPQCYVEVRS